VENRLACLSNALVIALISYRFAELKLRYPIYFYISALNLNLKRHDKLQRLIEEARNFGIELVSLDINKSDKGFTISEGKIIMGLSVLLNVEEDVIDDILKVRQETGEFKNISHFCSKINVKNLSKSLIEDLICAGAFDYTGDKRSAMFPVVKDIIKNSKKTKEEEGSSQFSLLSSDKTKDLILESANATIDNNIDEWDIGTKLRNEKDAIGFYITEHPISKYMKSTQRGDYISIQQAKQVVEGDVTILGLITRVEERTSKSGNPWCKVRVEDLEDSIDVLAFSRTYSNFKSKLIKGKVYIFQGKVSDDQRKSIFLDNLSEPDKPVKKKPISNKKEQYNKNKKNNFSKNIETIEEKERKNGSIFKILIREKLVDYDILIKLKNFLTSFKGDKTVHFLLSRYENDTDPIELEAGDFKVTGDSNMQYQLLNKFGEYVKRVWSE
jgi:DNA polymerase-3 subunit alpha